MKMTSHKTIPSIERKPLRKFKVPFLPPNPPSLAFIEPQQLIFKAQILTLTLELEPLDFKQITLSLTSSHATLKSKGQFCSVPYTLGKAKWLRIILGQEIKRVELKPSQQDAKIDRNQIYRSMDVWKQTTKEDVSLVHHFYFLPLLGLLKSKMEKKQKMVEVPSKNSIGSFIKTRISQRNNLRTNSIPFRHKNEALTSIHHIETQNNNDISKTYETLEKKSNQTLHHEFRKGSNTFQKDQSIHSNTHHYPNHLKESNTSTAISGQPDIKFNRRMIKKLKEKSEQKVTQSQKHPMFNEHSQFFGQQQKNKFYQHMNISQEEIDLKRKKFDSQFIYKKEAVQTTKEIAPERNDSEVTQQICRAENSQQLNPLEDTLEKGFVANNVTNKDIDESGTLYESVYQ